MTGISCDEKMRRLRGYARTGGRSELSVGGYKRNAKGELFPPFEMTLGQAEQALEDGRGYVDEAFRRIAYLHSGCTEDRQHDWRLAREQVYRPGKKKELEPA